MKRSYCGCCPHFNDKPAKELIAKVFPTEEEQHKVACLVGGLDGRLVRLERALRVKVGDEVNPDFAEDLDLKLENQAHQLEFCDERLRRLENWTNCPRSDVEFHEPTFQQPVRDFAGAINALERPPFLEASDNMLKYVGEDPVVVLPPGKDTIEWIVSYQIEEPHSEGQIPVWADTSTEAILSVVKALRRLRGNTRVDITRIEAEKADV